jgi:hypothetical protein
MEKAESLLKTMTGGLSGKYAEICYRCNLEEGAQGSNKEATMAAKSSKRKYGRKASHKVKRAMHERKHGKLKSGRSRKKVKSRKQAIAIGLSEARRSGAKVPKPKRKKKS